MKQSCEVSVTVSESAISRLACELWEKAGRPAGRDLEFWLQAENQVRAAAAAPSTNSAASQSGRGRTAKKNWPKPYPPLPKF